MATPENEEEKKFQAKIRATPWFSEFKKKYGYDAYMDLIELTSHINTENNLKEINEYKVNILTDNQFVKGEKDG